MTWEGCLAYRRRMPAVLGICCEGEQDCGGPPTCFLQWHHLWSPWNRWCVTSSVPKHCLPWGPDPWTCSSPDNAFECPARLESFSYPRSNFLSFPQSCPSSILSHLLGSLRSVPARKLRSDTTPVSPSHVLAASLWVGWILCFVCFLVLS